MPANPPKVTKQTAVLAAAKPKLRGAAGVPARMAKLVRITRRMPRPPR